ncbi:MAG: hypothetical protein B7Y56_05090 [Gallionellales bacterium 35-53-114]|jgi:uncharacterized membrane protein YjgN (DUF898 family)|nr:MAG: hypothetical protein B7Y56_05090 [Gallionellales bacterium 35-53-114]OYZ65460.1 MAG: hypothetical protein B7Y04_02245 [Gallionellales bacterium 24-53-125]OZB08366.1 MAG: hypothetical protein B7X61_12700 [Gallionellales bacterium 39-52-133]HQS58309.1 YjgN family protein [Gallionellaceae bacterium]HQS73864.1 YjgN family protein [Gallionellaceae bacterium]
MQNQEQRFKFTGNGTEYFGIWMVNLLLSILTLGIYSAWAKVRRMQYFYRNTWLNDASFDYHGTAIAILKGRIIAIVLFASYSIFLQFMPAVGLTIALLIALIMPYLLVISFRFRLYNSSYRGLRFGFTGSIKGAYFAFLALPFFTLLTLYLLAPFTHQRIKAYQHSNSRFGQSAFSFHAGAGGFYMIYLFTLLQLLLIAGLFAFGGYTLARDSIASLSREAIVGIVVAAYFLLILASLLVVPFFMSRIQNLVWNHTQLGEHHFSSTLSARGLAWIIFTNFFLIIFTMGLYKPFADIRIARYRVEHMALLPAGNIEEFIASEQQKIGATGTETAEMFDVDIGF